MGEPWESTWAVAHATTLVRSFRHWLGRDFLPGVSKPLEYAEELFAAPFVIVSHDTQADPVLNYGNRAALTLWEMSWEELTRTPSRLTVEPVARCDGLRDLGAHQISVALVAVLSRPDGTAELLSPAVLM
jgi:MEKHLA domain